MRKFVICTDSSCDLERPLREKYNLDYASMHYSYDGIDMECRCDWENLPAPDFYNIMREGKRILTSQIPNASLTEMFEHHINEGYDILYLACSSALSASVKVSYVVREELAKKYPEARIVCVDTLRACAGLGLICIMAARLRDEGKTIDEVAEWVENNRLKINQIGSVDKLVYLKRAGRISAASAIFGGLLNIKPIIISDVNGMNHSVAKVKGRMTSLTTIADMFKECYEVSDAPIFITHADCYDDAEILKAEIIKRLPEGANPEIFITYVGAAVGASVGPGMIGVYCFGKEVTVDSNKA